MTQQFKAGDRVIVVQATASLTQGQTYTVSGHYSPHRKDLVTLEGKTDGFYNHRFVLADEKPEVGDTVEVTYDDGTRVSGVVSHIYSTSGSFDIGVDAVHYVSADDIDKVKIIEKAVKPKVWAVGDVVDGGDYVSETIKGGTVAGDHNAPLVKIGESWVDVSTGTRFNPALIFAPRTIVYIPEVSA